MNYLVTTTDGSEVNIDVLLKEAVSLKPENGETKVTLKSGSIITLRGEWKLGETIPYFGGGCVPCLIRIKERLYTLNEAKEELKRIES